MKVYRKFFEYLNLYYRYDGVNFVTYNVNAFLKTVYPYIKHRDKINDIRLICNLGGKLNLRFLNILNKIHKNPGIQIKELAKLLKRVKVYSQIRFLEEYGYIYSQSYPKEVYITEKGLKEINHDY